MRDRRLRGTSRPGAEVTAITSRTREGPVAASHPHLRGLTDLTYTQDRARDLAKPPVHAVGVGEGHSDAGLYWAQQGDFTATPQVSSSMKNTRRW